MENSNEYLNDWAYHFFKNKDLILRSIKNIDKESNPLTILYKNDTALEILSGENLKELIDSIDKDKTISIVTFNTSSNYKILIEEWQKIVIFEKLTIYFINPNSVLDKKWIIKPYIHNRISEISSLKTGLKTMFQTVAPIKASEIKNLIKNS